MHSESCPVVSHAALVSLDEFVHWVSIISYRPQCLIQWSNQLKEGNGRLLCVKIQEREQQQHVF